MKPISISDARAFSLERIHKTPLVDSDDLTVTLLCFEAGQRDDEADHAHTTVYQVLEGEALVRHDGGNQRLGKGRLLAVPGGTPHTLENAGGGLLVVVATTPR